MMNNSELATLLDISVNLRESVGKQIMLLEKILEKTEGDKEASQTLDETVECRQTKMEEHFKKRRDDDQDWCMVDSTRPVLQPTTNVRFSTNEPVLPRSEETTSPVRRSTRNRHPPKRMDGILVGDELEEQMNKHDRIKLLIIGGKYHKNREMYKKLFDQYEDVDDMYTVLDEIIDDDSNQFTREEFEDCVAILVKWDRTTSYSEEILEKFIDELFEVLVKQGDNRIVRHNDLRIALGVLFEQTEDNLEDMYMVYDINDVGHLYSVETIAFYETFYKMTEFLNGNIRKNVDRNRVVSEINSKLNIDIENKYIRVSYQQLDQLFLGDY